MKDPVAVIARTGLMHSFATTSGHEHDLNHVEHLLHGKEALIFADSRYRDAENREELKIMKAEWYIAA